MNPKKLIGAKTARHRCGDVSDMAFWRWLHDPELNFPRPVYIRRRRFWDEDELTAWIEERAVASGEAA